MKGAVDFVLLHNISRALRLWGLGAKYLSLLSVLRLGRIDRSFQRMEEVLKRYALRYTAPQRPAQIVMSKHGNVLL